MYMDVIKSRQILPFGLNTKRHSAEYDEKWMRERETANEKYFCGHRQKVEGNGSTEKIYTLECDTMYVAMDVCIVE